MLNPKFIEEMKQELLKAKSRLQAELVGLKMHTELGTDTDANAQEVEDDELSQELIFRIRADLEKIEKAFLKIEKGTYGTDDLGKPIAEKRLRAIPWADKAI